MCKVSRTQSKALSLSRFQYINTGAQSQSGRGPRRTKQRDPGAVSFQETARGGTSAEAPEHGTLGNDARVLKIEQPWGR